MVLGGRTFFALAGLATIASMLVFLFGQENAAGKASSLEENHLCFCGVSSLCCTYLYQISAKNNKNI